MFKKKKFWFRLIIGLIVVPVLSFGVIIAALYWKQDDLVAELLGTFNEDFVGELEVEESHISPFSNFPHITVDLDHVKVWEGKDKHDLKPIVDVEDIYVGFNLWTVLTGTFDISFLRVEKGEFDVILHEDGSFNVLNALSSSKPEEVEDVGEEFHIHLKAIQLKDLDIHKYDEANDLDVEAYVNDAEASFKSKDGHMKVELKSHFLLNVIDRGDTTVIRHKHFYLDTHLDYLEEEEILVINPSEVMLEHGVFGVEGSLDIKDSLNLDIKIHGNKPNFDLFIAFAPEELIPTLEQYENAGTIYFEGTVKGKSVNGLPAVDVKFGCDQAWFKNTTNKKSVQDLHFDGHFTNTLNETHDLSAMQFTIQDFRATPEAGFFQGDVNVQNFESPDIEVEVNSDFNLGFLASFLNFNTLKNLDGQVLLKMKFHDIIDLANPERSIEKLNEAYYSELKVTDLTFTTSAFHLPIDKINAKIHMDGHEADIDYVDIKVGNSDIHVDGMVSDLPSILHHTDDLVDSRLNIQSNFLDIYQLTATADSSDTTKKPVDEQIKNLRLKLDFKSSAKAFTESEHMPEGEFFIEDMYAELQHYPHAFHDFHADIIVETNDLRIIDFTGMIDTSDFHFSGKLHDYAFWFADSLSGDTRIEFDLKSDHLRLEDLFSYKGENYVPEDYRHEELTNLHLDGHADLHFKGEFHSADVRLDHLTAKMKIHPLKFEKFNGRIHFEDDHVQIDTLYGKIGKSSFTADLNYYIGDDEAVRKRDNHLGLHAQHLDIDELMNYSPPPSEDKEPVDHEAVFNIYDLPFTPMTFDLDIGHLNYHRYLIDNIEARFRTESNHYIRIDTLSLYAAGGRMAMNGYFDGTNRDLIYLNPNVTLTDINLDKLLYKFENFGQDHLVSENLHGKLSGNITGHIHMHPDMVPKIDDSEIHMDINVLEGRFENFEPLLDMAEYFGDKNLASVKFDSLYNHLDVQDGFLNIPNMTINTTLGHMDLSGSQKMSDNYDIDYYIRVPMKMVTEVAKQKLFGKKNKVEADSLALEAAEEEEIIFKDHTEKIKYLNIRVYGDLEDYKIKLGKDKREKKKKKKKDKEKGA